MSKSNGMDEFMDYTSRAIQAFLDFLGFDFCDFRFTAVYNSILFSSPLVLLSKLDLRGFYAFAVLFLCPHINSVNQGMPVTTTQAKWLIRMLRLSAHI